MNTALDEAMVAVLTCAGFRTPAEGYAKAPHLLVRDVQKLVEQRNEYDLAASVEAQARREALAKVERLSAAIRSTHDRYCVGYFPSTSMHDPKCLLCEVGL